MAEACRVQFALVLPQDAVVVRIVTRSLLGNKTLKQRDSVIFILSHFFRFVLLIKTHLQASWLPSMLTQ